MQCWARATCFSSRNRDVRQFFNPCATGPRHHRAVFQIQLFRHLISATAVPRHLILAPLHHILDKKISTTKYLRNWAVFFFKKCTPIHFLLTVPVTHLWPSLLSPVSNHMSPVSGLLSHLFCFLAHVSCFLSPVSGLTFPVAHLLSNINKVSCLLSFVSRLLSHASRLLFMSRVSRLLSRVSYLMSNFSCLTSPF